MAYLLYDELKTPEGRSKITEITFVKINQHTLDQVFFFENGCTARIRHNISRAMMGYEHKEMKFRHSEPRDAWTPGGFVDVDE